MARGAGGGARHPEGIVSSLVWNAPQVRRRCWRSFYTTLTHVYSEQRSTFLSDGESIHRSDGMTFAAGRDGSCDESMRDVEGLKSDAGK
ncbi:hypothetical protein TRAPUB_3378 [Trametes pubescens]|uniref:Uncharacterized protein n=1 Tax=Trametes pubescens TaxID=154538 RepID=A0A1M2VDV6_TRAPU|nr:hypothetical protein TRAPUB_3378 [Trametes pubescens]